jgi:hypothetical protein
MTVIRGRTGFPGACFVYNYRRSSDLSSTVSPGVIHFSFGDSVGRINVKDIYEDDHTVFWTLFAENGGVLSLRNETGRFYTTSVTSGTVTNGIVTLNFSGPFDARLVNNEVYINAAANGSEGSGGSGSISGTTATSLTGYLKGNGSVVSASTGLPAADLTGTIADARLSENVPLLDEVGQLEVPLLRVGEIFAAFDDGLASVDIGGLTKSGYLAIRDNLNEKQIVLRSDTGLVTVQDTSEKVTISSTNMEFSSIEPDGRTTVINRNDIIIASTDDEAVLNANPESLSIQGANGRASIGSDTVFISNNDQTNYTSISRSGITVKD